MSILKHNLAESCDLCGCTNVVCEKILTHNHEIRTHVVNSERWEERHFSCGRTVYWIPNYSSQKRSGGCINDEECINRNKEIKDLEYKISELYKKKQLLECEKS